MLTKLIITNPDSGLDGDSQVSYPIQNRLLQQSVAQGARVVVRVVVRVQNKVCMQILELFDGDFLDSMLEALGGVLFDAD